MATVFANADTGSWRLARPVADAARCVRCGTCARYCPGAVVTVDRKAREPVSIDLRYCKGCGICANECPAGCIQMVPEGGQDHAD